MNSQALFATLNSISSDLNKNYTLAAVIEHVDSITPIDLITLVKLYSSDEAKVTAIKLLITVTTQLNTSQLFTIIQIISLDITKIETLKILTPHIFVIFPIDFVMLIKSFPN